MKWYLVTASIVVIRLQHFKVVTFVYMTQNTLIYMYLYSNFIRLII